jgi:hypothetical protein
MLNMRLTHPFETIALDQVDDSAKARPHVLRESFKFISNGRVEQFYRPRHPLIVLQFCNTGVVRALPIGRGSRLTSCTHSLTVVPLEPSRHLNDSLPLPIRLAALTRSQTMISGDARCVASRVWVIVADTCKFSVKTPMTANRSCSWFVCMRERARHS